MSPDSTPTRPVATTNDTTTDRSVFGVAVLIVVVMLAIVGATSWSSARDADLVNAVPATIAPRPTNPPPTTDASETSYLTFVAQQGAIMGASLRRLNDLIETPSGSDAWTIAVAVELMTWEQVRDDVAERTPPAPYTEMHLRLRQALDSYVTAGDLLTRGIDTLDPDLIADAAAEMRQGTTDLNAATAAIQAHG